MIPAAALLRLPFTDDFVEGLRPVDPRLVSVRLPPRWVLRIWPRWVSAMTTPWGIYLRPEMLAADDRVLATTIAHELVHVRQWKTLGAVPFLGRYVGQYLRNRVGGMSHRQAYRAIGLEEEAYRLAASCLVIR